ncbi:response regulator [Jeotgalibacillus proteolyticus]|uniref:Two-component system response regulator n=1 Tax=Jeotgalibacillus proteolyticus TaxID=2082395 RepID=A0A2S5GFH7_9BACL|nr:response regulator [Jeotgalibacillus proteolyticus]PPA71797.1 two-component system response regulator [Jeotgalibacillus proteolyticus]
MKVMITDDEVQIRKGLKMKIDWETEGFEIVEEASNGQEALDKLHLIQADIVITDMRMPIMNGIEFAKRCQRDFPEIKVIVLSGYSDFEYVRNSMKEGVRDYLLKPVAPDELREVMHKVRKEIQEDRAKRAEAVRMNNLIQSHIQEEQERYLLFLVKDEYLRIHDVKERLKQLQLKELAQDDLNGRFFTVEIREQEKNTEKLHEYWLPFQLLIKEIVKEFSSIYSFYNPNYKNMVHFFCINKPTKIPAVEFIKVLQQKTKKYLNLETVIGAGDVIYGIEEFKKGYISSLLSWSQSEGGPKSQIIYGSSENNRIFEFSADFERKLLNAIENTNYSIFKETVEKELNVIHTHSVLSFSIIANHILFLLSSTISKYDLETEETKKNLWNCQQYIWELNAREKVIDSLLDFARLIVEMVHTTRFSNAKLIESIKNYIDIHYADEISLTSLSELFHINGAHLSETFKSQIGTNFSDYLVKVRMEKAEVLLKDTDLKIIDVANLVGFSSSGYFSTVFKKHVKQTPVEYRRTIETKEKKVHSK